MQTFHLGFAVQQQALLLDPEGCQRIVVVQNGHIAVHRGGEHVLVFPHFPEEALHLKEAAAGHIVCIQNTVAELLGTLGSATVTKIHQPVAAVGHALPAPQLGLVGPGQKAGDIMPLGTHDGLSDPEILALQAPDIIQAKGDLRGGQRFFLAAPHRVVVESQLIQAGGHIRIAHMLGQTAAGEVVHDHGAGQQLMEQIRLEADEVHQFFATKALPFQAQGRVVGGDGGIGQGDLLKGVVFLAPESGAEGIVQFVDVPCKGFVQMATETVPAVVAPTQVAALVADLVVHLPSYDALLAPVMLGQGRDDLTAGFQVMGVGIAGYMPPAEGTGGTVREAGKDIGILGDEPSRRGSRGGAEDNLQALLLGHGNDPVKVGEVKLTFLLFHAVPGKFTDADHIAAQFQDAVHVCFHQGSVPLFGIIINAQKHGTSSFLYSPAARDSSLRSTASTW